MPRPDTRGSGAQAPRRRCHRVARGDPLDTPMENGGTRAAPASRHRRAGVANDPHATLRKGRTGGDLGPVFERDRTAAARSRQRRSCRRPGADLGPLEGTCIPGRTGCPRSACNRPRHRSARRRRVASGLRCSPAHCRRRTLQGATPSRAAARCSNESHRRGAQTPRGYVGHDRTARSGAEDGSSADAGSSTSKQVPCGPVRATRTEPPWSAKICCTVGRPRPVPRAFRV